jgi:hypothetical protein
VELLVVSPEAGEAGNGGEVRWPAARAPPDWRSRGLRGGRCLVEEKEEVAGELWSFTAGRGVERSGGDGGWPELGFGLRPCREEEKWEEGKPRVC